MNMTKAIAGIKAVFIKPEFTTLEQRFEDQLEIHIEPYAELGEKQLEILQAIADDAPFIDEHNLRAGKVPNPYNFYAFYKRGKETYICPVHDFLPTCLNPLSMEEDAVLLGRWSVGGSVSASRLKDLVKEGYLVGYAIKR